jgi:Lon protease-like protein
MPQLATSLPSRYPVFPLRGALLLPGGNLPLNIFEPRYLQMVRDAMQTDRVIAMVQPKAEDDASPAPELYRTGCVGRITSFEETGDGRFLITLTGLCRFDIAAELDVPTPYRQVEGDFGRWRQDMQPAPPPAGLKPDLVTVLKAYFDRHGIEADWDAIDAAPLAGLVTSLCMICPFEAEEKQALLEAPDQGRQTKLLIALMQMEALAEPGGSTLRH